MKASLKLVSSAAETSLKKEISLVLSIDMILSNKRITKALIRKRGCAGWSAPLLFAKPRRQDFSHRSPYDVTSGSDVTPCQVNYILNIMIYSLLSIPRISRDWAKYVELSVVRGNQIMTYTHHFGAKKFTFNSSINRSLYRAISLINYGMN